MRTFTIILALLALPALGFSKTIYVPDYCPRIQDAINGAVAGDIIIVRPDSVNGGPYKENIDFLGMAVTVKSEFGSSVTTIDAQNVGSVVMFHSYEGPDSVLEGFTLTNGTGTYTGTGFSGGGIYCREASPTIMNCNIVGNSVDEQGGGIYCKASCAVILNNTLGSNHSWSGAGVWCQDGIPSIDNNFFVCNTADHSGGGIACYQASPRILNNTFTENMGCWGPGIMLTYSSPVISNNLIFANFSPTGYWSEGGGIYCQESSPVIQNNTIAYNQVESFGGGICCASNSSPLVVNTILWNNYAPVGTEISVRQTSHLLIECCDVKGGHALLHADAGSSVTWGSGMINADPQFYYGPSGAFYLGQNPCEPGLVNPCVDSGSNLAVNLCMDTCWTRTDGYIDVGVVDMGFHYGPHVLPTLEVTAYEISQSSGGVADFILAAGPDHMNRHYLILGGVSGTSPGTVLPGGLVLLPVNWDPYTDLVLKLVNTPLFKDFLGGLDASGRAEAQLKAPPLPAAAVGLVMNYAYCLNAPFDYASNPVEIHIVP